MMSHTASPLVCLLPNVHRYCGRGYRTSYRPSDPPVICTTHPQLHTSRSTATRYSVQGDCSGIEGAGEGFRATWFLYDPDIPAAVEVSAWRGFGDVWRAEPNTNTSYGYFWVDANGIGYSLTGGKGQLPEDTLVAIARSLDPTFDPANLTPVEDEVVPLPRPLPETIR